MSESYPKDFPEAVAYNLALKELHDEAEWRRAVIADLKDHQLRIRWLLRGGLVTMLAVLFLLIERIMKY